MPHCERLISFLNDNMGKLSSLDPADLRLDHIVNCLRNASEEVLLFFFDRELVNKLGMRRNEWIDRQSDVALKMEGQGLLQGINLDVSCLIAGFLSGQPMLLRSVGKNVVEEIVSHAAVGIGAQFALQKLASRTQGPYCSIQRTALGFSEALRYAKRMSRGLVGHPAFCAVLEPGGLVSQFDSQSGVLRNWSKVIKASRTDLLDSDKYWEEFRPLLEPVSKQSRLAGAQTLGQAQ